MKAKSIVLFFKNYITIVSYNVIFEKETCGSAT